MKYVYPFSFAKDLLSKRVEKESERADGQKEREQQNKTKGRRRRSRENIFFFQSRQIETGEERQLTPLAFLSIETASDLSLPVASEAEPAASIWLQFSPRRCEPSTPLPTLRHRRRCQCRPAPSASFPRSDLVRCPRVDHENLLSVERASKLEKEKKEHRR